MDGSTILSDLTQNNVQHGSTVNRPSNLSKDGYVIDNWFANSDLIAVYSFATPVTGDMYLYAKWTFEMPIRNVALIKPYLDTQAGTIDNPADLPMQIDLGTMSQAGSGWRQILTELNTAGKYVDLDLSRCAMSGGSEFNPDRNVSTGKDKIVSIALPNTAISIAVGASSIPTFRHFTVLKSFGGTGLTTIGNYAFYGLTSIAMTSLPAGIASIGDHAFSKCNSLTQISFPAGLISIGENAFYSCTGLVQISLPAGLTSIGSGAFSFCSNLAIVTCLAETPPTMKQGSLSAYGQFSNTPSSQQIKVPAASVDAYKKAAGWNTWATRIRGIE
jgi:hypothetical protein